MGVRIFPSVRIFMTTTMTTKPMKGSRPLKVSLLRKARNLEGS